MGAVEFASNVTTAWAWPLIVGVLGVLFIAREHKAIGRLIDRIKSGSVGPVSFDASEEAVAATVEAARALESIGGAESADGDGIGAVDDDGAPNMAREGEVSADHDPKNADAPSARDPESTVTLTRDELRTLVTEFADAGWAIRGTERFKDFPEPVLRWERGRPSLDVWRARSPKDVSAVIKLNSAVADRATQRSVYREILNTIEHMKALAEDPRASAVEREQRRKVLRHLETRRDEYEVENSYQTHNRGDWKAL